ncbi:hypothetical protein JZ751_017094 [Albula glossodonta]|uniref:Uncharacterized protein n=1 Tax=Albula glossodonta TaxID=121402 RepID=A0A8T2P0E5_9TELE|nr:hypothetical protein JZ751_017094 [Albula glossodonta]
MADMIRALFLLALTLWAVECQAAAGRPRARNAPSVPDRDYEALNLGTRDTYAVAGMNRNG